MRPTFISRFAACAALASLIGLAAVMGSAAKAAEPPSAAASPTRATTHAPAPARYTFSWPLEAGLPQPRGGTSRGAPTTLDRQPGAAWQSLQATGLTAQERDRRAILAMAGTFRVSFDFLDIDVFGAAGPLRAPYQSWGTEKVYVDANEPGFVSLVHILEMRVLDAKGVASAPMVTKHWRQDWRWQPAEIVEYQGGDRWQRRALGEADRRDAWVQTVYQVDESPRYASLGRWQHNASFSTWISADTWRPLPRREWTVRKDYQLLTGTNRHTVGPTGWTQEENNLKTVFDARGQIDAARPFVAREYGVARYERLQGADFALADRYYERTRPFWNQVRAAWSDAFARQATLSLRGQVDQLGLFMPLFERADLIEAKAVPPGASDDAAVIAQALAAMGVQR